MRFLQQLWYSTFYGLPTIMGLLASRILFAGIALLVLIIVITRARKGLAPTLRSWLWALCIPLLILPFEHSAIIIMQNFTAPEGAKLVLERLIHIWNYIWPAGVIFFAIHMSIGRKRTLRLIKRNCLSGCAAYLYKGKSHIYLPPDFESIYTSEQQEMLLAHEHRHIAQHDPWIFRFLQVIQCVFWFCPHVHKAVRLIRQDRELLCDERVIQSYSGKKYASLLLNEAQKNMDYPLPGIAAETGSIYERIAACIKPFSGSRKPFLFAVSFVIILFGTGFAGFVKPIVTERMEVNIFLENDETFLSLEGAEKFVQLTEEGIVLDQPGLLEYLESLGLHPQQSLYAHVTQAERLTLTSSYTVSSGSRFTMEKLKTDNLIFPYYDAGFKPWSVLFKLL